MRRFIATAAKVGVFAVCAATFLTGVQDPYRSWARPATYACLRTNAGALVPLDPSGAPPPSLANIVDRCMSELVN